MTVRAVNIEVAGGAILIAPAGQIVRRNRAYASARLIGQRRRVGVTFQAKEFHLRARQHLRIGRAVRRVAGLTAFLFDRRVFVDERPLFVGVTFQTGRVAVSRIA